MFVVLKNKFYNMRRFILILLLLIPFINWGQINNPATVIGWENGEFANWTQIVGTYNATGQAVCSGNTSIRTGLIGSANLGTSILKSPKIGATNGGVITFSFDYKWLLSSNVIANPTPAPANRLDLKWQWSNKATGPWYTFDTVDETNHVLSTTCRTMTSTFAAYPGDLYIRIVTSSTNPTGDYYLYLDNINILEDLIPASCGVPRNVRVSTKTSSDFTINWNAPSGGQAPVNYDWEVRTSGKPGSGPIGLVVGGNTLGLTAGATGLVPDTTYEIYVRANCAPPEVGSWIGIENVTFCDWPPLNVATNRNVCGIQTIDLTAPGAGAIFWFDKDHNLVAQGVNTFTTPEITESTKYHVFSGITNVTSNTTINIGAGIGANTTSVPFNNNPNTKVQYIYLASELKAAGFTKGIIKSFGFKALTGGTLQRNNFGIYMGLTTLEEFGNTDFIPTANLQQVKNTGNQTLVASDINMFNLDTPFIWDGYSNVVVQFTYADTATTLTATSVVSSLYDGSSRALYSTVGAAATTGILSTVRINGYFDILEGCFGPSSTINLNFTPAPDLILSSNTVNNCAGSPLQKIYILTGVSDYNTYKWTTIDPNDTTDPVNDPTHPNNPVNAIVGDQNIGWTFNTTTTMTYVLRVSNTATGCVIKHVVNVVNNPAPQMLQLQNSYNLCTNDVQELKVDDFVNETPVKHLFNGSITSVILNNGVIGDLITNETSMFSEGTGSLKVSYAAQTNATVDFDTTINMFNLKSIEVEFDHIAALQATSTSVLDYAYVEYTTDNGATWKSFLPANYAGSASTTLTKPVGNTSLQAMFFTRTSYVDWNSIQQTTVPTTVPWKSEKFVVPATDFTGTGTFKVRFRIGSDGNTQYPGWYIDNVKITPISNYQISWLPIANLYYDQAATIPYDAAINSGKLYLKGSTNSLNVPYKVELVNQVGCKVEKNFTVSIGLKESPIVNNIDSCGFVDVVNTNFGKNPNGVLTYYNSQMSSTPITQFTTSGVYYVEQEISGCKSARVPFTVVISPIAPVPNAIASQSFCGSATVNDIVINLVQGFQIKWFTTSSLGTALPANTPINNGTYYGEFTNGVCVSPSRVPVTVTVAVIPAAITMNNVYICGISTIADIKVSSTPGATVNWYQNISDVTPLANTTVLATGTYYIAQKANNCESTRTAVAVSAVQNLTTPTTTNIQTFCGSATVGSLTASATTAGANVYWYGFSTSDTPLANTTPLTSGTYYVGQSVGDCDSPKKAVSVRILSVNAPVINPISVCGDATVSSLPLNPSTGTNYRIYSSAFATTDMGQNDVITTGTYYISVVDNGCETARAAVYVTVNARPNAPTGNINQIFQDYAEVNKLKANEPNVVWFDSYNDAVNNANPLLLNHPLQNGKTYYGVVVGPGNCASLPFEVTVKIVLGLNDLDLASLKYYPNPVDSELTVSYKETIKLIEVYDILGKQIKTQKFDANEVRFDVSTLSAGTYMVKVHTNEGSQFIKIVKK